MENACFTFLHNKDKLPRHANGVFNYERKNRDALINYPISLDLLQDDLHLHQTNFSY